MALQGVNLGGWLIIEKWMTPWLFEGTAAVDEYTFMQTPGALQRLQQHHAEFITERDFKWMANSGVQIVRIPVGYWVLNGDAPYASAIETLDRAFSLCKKYNIQVLLDIHGLPGSQNGHDHSGHVGKPQWHKNPQGMQYGLGQTVAIAARYAKSPVLWGVQYMNEPLVGWHVVRLRRYYRQAYAALSAVLPPQVRLVYHDAFLPRLMNGAVRARTHPVAMDIHWYHTVGWRWLSMRWWQRLTVLHGRLVRSLRKSNGVIVGEWSGIYAQRIFDAHPQVAHLAMVARNAQQQIRAYENADAWFYWSYKASGPGAWDFKSLVDGGYIRL